MTWPAASCQVVPAHPGHAMTTIPRLYVPAALTPGAAIAATAAQAHYLGTVLRCGANDPVHLFNGRDGEWQARIGDTPP